MTATVAFERRDIRVIGLVSGAHFFSHFFFLTLPPLYPILRVEMGVSYTALGATAIREAVSRAKIDPASVGHLVLGSVIHGEARDMYISRVAAVDGGLPFGTPCLTVNRLCGSGLQSIVSAAQHILLGDTDCVIGAGAESMSRAAYFLPAMRFGQRMGDAVAMDAMTATLHDPFGNGHMGTKEWLSFFSKASSSSSGN